MSRTRAICRKNRILTAKWSFEAIDFGPIKFIMPQRNAMIMGQYLSLVNNYIMLFNNIFPFFNKLSGIDPQKY